MSIIDDPLFSKFFQKFEIPKRILHEEIEIKVNSVSELRDALNKISDTEMESTTVDTPSWRYEDQYDFMVSYHVAIPADKVEKAFQIEMRKFEHLIWKRAEQALLNSKEDLASLNRELVEIDNAIPHVEKRVALPVTSKEDEFIFHKAETHLLRLKAKKNRILGEIVERNAFSEALKLGLKKHSVFSS